MLAVLVLLGAAAAAAARELDPAACGARFDVQRDKIIRTEESREMGARYLSELDVGSRHECRRLCCETDACDVFVFEEKSPGSCYLFNCGPPEDFRCKFTAHGNFSSGVLALSRRLAELQDQERLAARPPPRAMPAPITPPPPPPPPSKSTWSPAAATTRPSTAPAPRPSPPPPAPQRPGSGRCSRYQWECHSGGECIAVYNACDGVPQCADGSDEAPELGCPAASTAPPRAAPASPPPPLPARPAPLYPVQMYEQEASGADSRAAAGAGAGGGVAGAGAGAAAGEERWPHRLLQAQPRRYPAPEVGVADSGPHIFSHAGGLVQEEPAFEPPAPAWPRRYLPHQGVNMELGWGGWGREWPEERRPWPVAPPPSQQEQQIPVAELPPYLSKTVPELPAGAGAGPAGRPHDAPKKGPPAPLPAPAAPADLPPPDNATKKKAAAVVSESSLAGPKVVPVGAGTGSGAGAGGAPHAEAAPHSAPAPHAEEHDGLSEHPPAAVVLLVLGVGMTGALAALVGCRARAARRRRGGRKPLAHDADYLVNGMYL